MQSHIEDIVEAQIEIQQIPNPSGSPALDGLGEPKFYVNKTAFVGEIGRPQRGIAPLFPDKNVFDTRRKMDLLPVRYP